MGTQVMLVAVAVVGFAVLVAFVLPRFSRAFLGPATVVMSLVAAFTIFNDSSLGRDAWGPARAVIGLFVGFVGVVVGLVLIGVGAARSRRYSPDRPARA